ncbi:hypothetical protein [Faecalibacterium sp. An121]|uniref:hypothetical protein n=1 Tax=Faecalibacterium sp. An121 TaxID=1965550 RepID=UPI000B38068C|nr:hypothetical protein [Faecalibacterium sp. An121]OUQ39666.1 hypothetical protein B5E66_04240 [Faecalibacterium sp. An121]
MKRMVKRVASVSLAAAVAATAGSQALAVGWQPSRTQNEVEVVESVVSTGIGAQVAVTAGPSINPATGSILQVQQSQNAVIQVTPVSQTLAVNNAINAANPGLSAGQLSANPTASGLSYAANGQLNNLYNLVNAATSVGALLAANAPAAAANFTQVAGAPADAYTPLALYDIGVSAGAERIIAQGGNATIPLSVPGVTNGALVVAVCWDRAGNSRVVPAAVAGSVVYLNVITSGPVMILVRAR